jgi:hypothetical protein
MQYYLNKLPAEFIGAFPQLAEATAPPSPQQGNSVQSGLGTDYRDAQVNLTSGERQPFMADPALVERGLRGHADTQNQLAQALREAGLSPRSRLPHEPNFDLAWQVGDTVFVAEVKSITGDNEEEQLRLGLGQVLRYRQRLRNMGYERVVAVLVPERSPRDSTWKSLCQEVQVVLLAAQDVYQAGTFSEAREP